MDNMTTVIEMNNSITKLFGPHEMGVVQSFRNSLNDFHKVIFDEQISSVKVVCREYKETTVNMYSKKLWKTTKVSGPQFVNLPEEYLVASFFPTNDLKNRIKAELWFISGRPFSIEFSGGLNFKKVIDWECHLESYFNATT